MRCEATLVCALRCAWLVALFGAVQPPGGCSATRGAPAVPHRQQSRAAISPRLIEAVTGARRA